MTIDVNRQRNYLSMASFWLLILICGALSFQSNVSAQELFRAYAGSEHPAGFLAIDDTWITRERWVALNRQLLPVDAIKQTHGNAFSVVSLDANLFDDATFKIQQVAVQRNANGLTSWTGRVLADRPNLVNMVFNNTAFAAAFYFDGKSYLIDSNGGDAYRIVELNLAQFPDEEIFPVASSGDAKSTKSPNNSASAPIKILIVDPHQSRLAGASAAWAQLAIDQANAIYSNSGTKLKFSLINDFVTDSKQFSSTGQAAPITDARLRDSLGELRRDSGADFVAMWGQDKSSCGQGFQHPLNNPMTPGFALSLVNPVCVAAQFSLGRLLGFGLGLAAESRGDDKSIAHGFAVGVQGDWRTLMASKDACQGMPGNCRRLPLLSNPEKYLDGFPLGSDLANNVMAVNQLHFNYSYSVPPIAETIVDVFRSELDGAEKITSGDNPSPHRERWVRLNADADLVQASHLRLQLFDDVTVEAERLDTSASNNDSVLRSWSGRLIGADSGLVNLVFRGEQVTGVVFKNGAVFKIASAERGLVHVAEVDTTKMPEEHPGDVHVAEADANSNTLAFLASPVAVSKSSEAASNYIDVLVAYTETAKQSMADIEAQIQLAIDSANAIYHQAGIVPRLRLVKMLQLNYKESGDFNLDLERVRGTKDGYLDDVHALRDRYGADLVSLWVASTNFCGYGYMMTTQSANFASWGFSVISTACAVENLSFAHELGHNMGLNHDVYVSPGPGVFSDSHGYVNTKQKWRTIMAYNNACVKAGLNCVRIPHFSNPTEQYQGSSLGDKKANEVRTINATYKAVMAFRSPPPVAPEKVALIGSWNGWSAPLEMNRAAEGDNKWDGSIELKRGSYKYAFLMNKDWTKTWSDPSVSNVIPQQGTAVPGKENADLFVPMDGIYNVAIDAMSGVFSVSRAISADERWARTVILINAKLKQGQNIFLRGGIDAAYAARTRGSRCNLATGGDHNIACSVPITHRLASADSTKSWRVGDYFLDFGAISASRDGREPNQGSGSFGTPLVWTTNNVRQNQKVAADGLGYSELNTYGSDYWLLDVSMNCASTVDGWVEVRAFVGGVKGSGLEAAIAQTAMPGVPALPYRSDGHFVRCGMLNVFKMGQAKPVAIKALP